jgi:L-ascorbate metabolism protein UlaG (beta-lactamase superfamily)
MHHDPTITYIGHATLLIEIDGLRILTDPLLRSHVSGFIRRQTPLPSQKLGRIDLVLISHLHFDHFDLPSLRLLGSETPILAPRGAGVLLRRNRFHHVVEMCAGERQRLSRVTIEATHANHKGRRPPFGPHADCLGYLLHGKRTVYFAGDTDIFPEMDGLHHDLDVALMPVWGWGPTLGAGHMDPQRAAEALTLIRPRLAMPIHWGTFFPVGLRYSHGHLLSQPPHHFAQHARTLAPDVAVQIVAPGDRLKGLGVG